MGTKETAKYLLGLRSSRVLDWFWTPVSTPLRAWFYRCCTQFIEQLPIRMMHVGDVSEHAVRDATVSLAERILAASRADPDAGTSPWEREICERLYGLCGPMPSEIEPVDESARE